MKEFKIFLNLIKTNFKKLWSLFFLMIICAIFANFLTILQPLVFASMMEVVLPNDFELLNSQNNKTKSIRYLQAMPTNLGGIQFEATGSGTEFLTTTVGFRFTHFELV